MAWPQYHDADHHIGQLFQIEGLPSYFTIDSDGVLTSESLGGDSDIDATLRNLIARARTTTPTPSTPAPAQTSSIH
jgi:hypothetical protein